MADTDLKYSISSSYDSKGADAAAAQLRELKQQLDDLQNTRMQLRADSTQVTADIQRIKQEIAGLDAQIKMGLDDTDYAVAKAKIDELKAELLDLQDKKTQIGVDTSQLDADIAKIRLALAAIPDSKKVKIDEDSSAARNDLKDLQDQFDKTQKDMQDNWKRTAAAGTGATFSIATAIGALVVSMTPLAAGIISAGGAIVSGFGSAALAAGAFGLSLKSTIMSSQAMATNAYALTQQISLQQKQLGSLTAGSTAYKSLQSQITMNQVALNQSMQSGTPVQNQLAQSLLNLHMQWINLQTIMEKATGPLIQDGIHAISSAMQSMVPLVVSVANALRPMADQMVRFTSGGSNGISNSGFAKMIEWVEQVGIPNLMSLIQVIHNVIIMVAQIFVAWGDSGTNMMNDMVRITAEIDKWGADGGFARFQQKIQADMPMIKQFLAALWEALAKVTQSAYDFGPAGLSMVGIALKLGASLPIGAVQALFVAFMGYKVIAATVAIFSALGTAIDGVKLAMTAAKGVMLGFAASQEAATAAAAMGASAGDVLAASQDAVNLSTEEGTTARAAATVGTKLYAVGQLMAAVATGDWAAANAIWDATAAPMILTIGLIVLAVVAVGVGVYELVTHWSTAWRDIKGAFIDAWHAIELAFDDVVEFARGKWGIFITAIPIVGWLIYIAANWSRLLGDIKRYWDETWSAIKSSFDDVVSFVRGRWGIFVTAIPFVGWLIYIAANWQRIWSDIQSYFTTTLNAIKGAWDTVSSALSNSWNSVWNALKSAVETIWTALKTAWSDFLNAMKAAWDTVSSALEGAWNTVWNALKSAAQTVWDALKTAWNTFLDAVKTAWDTISSAVTSAWGTFWNGLSTTAKGVWDSITSGLSTFFGTIRSGFTQVVSDVKGIWGGIVSVFQTPINTIIGIWNTIAGAIGLPTIGTSASAPASLSNPGASTSKAGTVSVGTVKGYAAGGRITGPGGPRDDAFQIWASHGEYMMPADTVKHYGVGAMDDIRNKRFADGGLVGRDGAPAFGFGGFVSGLIGGALNAIQSGANAVGLGGVTSDVLNTLKSVAGTAVFDVASPILNGIVNLVPAPIPGTPAPAGDVPHAGAKTIVDFILNKLKGIESAAKTAAGPIPTGQHLALIDQALTKAGVPNSQWSLWEPDLNTIITAESNWDPTAINNSDSNAAAGHPSQGLMQTIPSTFSAYSLGGSITDPVSNIVAGIRYILATYGSISNVPGIKSKAAGGAYVGYDMGGALMPGLTMANNTTGAIEGVLNPTGLASIGGLSAVEALNTGMNPTGLASRSASGGFGAAVVLNMPITVNCESGDAEEIIEAVEEDLLPKLTVLLKQGLGAR